MSRDPARLALGATGGDLMKSWLIFVMAWFAWGVLPAGAAPLDQTLAQVMERFHFPGAVLLVSGPQGTEIATAGTANLAAPRPVTEATRFHIASVGKILTAIATLQLVEEGRLSLDAPVRPFLDPPEATRLTHIDSADVAGLLSHTSGLPDCLRNGPFSLPEHPSLTWTASEALRLGRCRAATEPGRFAYSNSNYILLGHILEKLDGGDLAEILGRRILAPLGMGDSAVRVATSDPLLAHGHRRNPDQPGHRPAGPVAWSSRLGDAPLTTTARDLERLMVSLFRPGKTRVLPTRMVAAMAIERGRADGEGYGLGLQVTETDLGFRYGHSGRFGGFAAEAWYYPDRDRIVILLANGDEFSETDPMDLIEEQLFPPADLVQAAEIGSP
ncbi:Beta-lactamase class C and other penicillin binding protein [Paramagnetospirillum magneticum AMB-1]|uniref:Beta-lactamase class C and other penicillin binding protein n=2 Tax=Paramagnetospirillum magneticum TaxID=84159 RepID=Q2W0T8_PARM1|nr:Beta-lactamase class C and other penicillin binding protein [Paramagnetospirillum magneticum AMB-1]